MRLTPAEVVLVIAILALISALAIPSLLAKRGSSNEASCRASLRTLTRVNENYRTRFHRYAATLRHLEGVNAELSPQMPLSLCPLLAKSGH